ncbi:3-oxo-5-alpha-steroid 4-dehydrogenase-like protein [Amylocarpus encephaloides]|uniref:Polyprenal reductase n=1 Tax=Amylocarpus encephaloides TaxID=45428 RepID=A0A9P8CA83_9HELO|nr:3-oxo-5-alpha-steroid 4-dehydrogenase-like protein [Amylocarpus encephaloides]
MSAILTDLLSPFAEPAIICTLFFTLGTVVSLGGVLIPSFRKNIMNYGSRGVNEVTTSPAQQTSLDSLIEWIAAFRIPHSWFTHYYVLSVLSSLFWAYQIVMQGSVFRLLTSYSSRGLEDSMSREQVFLVWGMMMAQGVRRLYESVVFAKSSNAKMWIGLWILGLAYYYFIGVAIWVEAIPVLTTDAPVTIDSRLSAKTIFSIAVFVTGSTMQHICHKHLANLKKYSLPQHPLFSTVVCPHYTCECFVYLAMAMAAAPPGSTFNSTVLSGLGFVAANLGVTADSTRKWYVEKFGVEKVNGRWRMIPFMY